MIYMGINNTTILSIEGELKVWKQFFFFGDLEDFWFFYLW